MTLLRSTIATLCILVLACAFTSTRYSHSGAFGGAISAYSRFIIDQEHKYVLLSNSSDSLTPTNNSFTRLHLTNLADLFKSPARALSASSCGFLLPSIVVRTILFWSIIRNIECSSDGLETFLPFILALADKIETRAFFLPKSQYDASTRKGASGTVPYIYLIVSFIWAMAVIRTFSLAEPGTGAICSRDIWGWMMPPAQLAMLGFDAWIIRRIEKLTQVQERSNEVSRAVGDLFLASAGVLAVVLVLSSCFNLGNLRWNLFLTSASVVDLLADSIAVAIVLISAIHLLSHLHPTFVGLTIVATIVLVNLQHSILDGTMAVVCSNWLGLALITSVLVSAAILIQQARPVSTWDSQSTDGNFCINRLGVYALLVFLFVSEIFFLAPIEFPPDSISQTIANARVQSNKWLSGAKQSQSLDDAVSEYKTRYGIQPPPNFDAWYMYAVAVNSPIIDDFGQIHHDLQPFWGTPPAVIRQRTAHLLSHPKLSFGGIIIENGKVSISPHIRGTHRWMMDSLKEMINPFARWLPDMQLAFNLDDECRISISHDDMRVYLDEALLSRNRLSSKTTFRSFSPSQDPPWPKAYLSKAVKLWDKKSPLFQDWSKANIFYEWISSTCPPDSPVHKFHWWDKKAECQTCSAPHMAHGIVSNWTLSGDLCHQPDLAYLHGFAASPAAFVATHALFPSFSQSRINNFADILYPSPWNFAEKVKYEEERRTKWEDKLNSVYWRGASSDGFALNGVWHGFLRSRFVSMAQTLRNVFHTEAPFNQESIYRRAASAPSFGSTQVAVNVSFVGEFEGRCEEGDCVSQHATFYGSRSAEPPPSTDFNEHWLHRHLIDLDGAAFSGRFLPFLRSASLPYRAALFRTWWEERVHPWRHFVPLDVRLADLWRVVRWFASRDGDEDAQLIARDGAEWAKNALRREDMRVYMFRVLLEWGRIVDDRREELGYVPQG